MQAAAQKNTTGFSQRADGRVCSGEQSSSVQDNDIITEGRITGTKLLHKHPRPLSVLTDPYKTESSCWVFWCQISSVCSSPEHLLALGLPLTPQISLLGLLASWQLGVDRHFRSQQRKRAAPRPISYLQREPQPHEPPAEPAPEVTRHLS